MFSGPIVLTVHPKILFPTPEPARRRLLSVRILIYCVCQTVRILFPVRRLSSARILSNIRILYTARILSTAKIRLGDSYLAGFLRFSQGF
jgi:hypothetical protein